ncbi:MAG: glycosyl hydrolase [Ignavibacteriaceae bacterium]
MKKLFLFFSLLAGFILSGCSASYNSVQYQKDLGIKLSDSLATKETVNLYANLKKLSERNIIFGHQHSTAYGVGWRSKQNFSDVKDVSDYFPGLYGWDFEILTPPNEVGEDWMRKLIIEAYERGGVNTFCWHYNNPVTGRSFYDTTIAVKHILPGGKYHNNYINALNIIAVYAQHLKGEDGELIPIIFRPFHEFDGSWFWWGKNFCTKEEFIALWQFTVTYLRDVKGVRNFIYAFSPDRMFYNEEQFLDRYPGDEYADILGMDNYSDFTGGDGIEWVTKKLKIVSRLAKKKNKIAAFTETGLEGIPDATWWTNRLLKSFSDDSIKIAYMMVWRNANETHHYAPHRNNVSAGNFVHFSRQPHILFEDHLPDLYSTSISDETLNNIYSGRNLDLLRFLLNYRLSYSF